MVVVVVAVVVDDAVVVVVVVVVVVLVVVVVVVVVVVEPLAHGACLNDAINLDIPIFFKGSCQNAKVVRNHIQNAKQCLDVCVLHQ